MIKTSGAKLSSPEKKIIFALGATHFVHIVDFMILMPLGPKLMRLLDISPAQFGLLVSSYTLAAGVSGLMASAFVDRFDRKRALVFLFVGFMIGTLVCGLVHEYYLLLAARIIAGGFGGVQTSVVFSIVGDSVPVERRALATSYVMLAFSAASIFGVPFSLYLAEHFNWNAPFLFLAGISSVILLYAKNAIPPYRTHIHQQKLQKWYTPIKNAVLLTQQRTALIFLGVITMSQFAMIPFISPTLVANAGLPEPMLPFLYLFGGTVTMIAGPRFGALSDRLGSKKVFLWSAFVSLLPIYLVSHMGPTAVPLILLVTSFYFLVSSGRMVPTMALLTRVVPPSQRGSFMSVVSSMQQFASSFGSLLAGQLIFRGSDGNLQNYTSVGWISISLTIVGMFLIEKIVPSEN